MATIQSKYLSHIVAFNYKNEYDSIIKNLKNNNWSTTQNLEVECDLCENIQNELYGNHTLGTLFSKPVNQEIIYFGKGFEAKVKISNSYIYLYKNGIGFFSYNFEADDLVDSEHIKYFLNKYKEYSYPQSALYIDTGKIDNNKKVYKVFMLGPWIVSELKNLNVKFIPERENIYKSIENIICNDAQIHNKLYMPENIELEYDSKYCDINTIPDKATLFTYLAFENNYNSTELEMDEFAYHVSNGYRDSYKYSPTKDNTPYHPFSNATWSASNEGCAYISYPDESNNKYFTKTLPERIQYSYKYLFIRALYEKISLQMYSNEISESIYYSSDEILKGSNLNKTRKLQAEVNLFRAKILGTSVSHVSHHLDFYAHIIERLEIEDLSKKLAASLDSINSVQESINSNKINIVLSIISAIQAISAIPEIFYLANILFGVNDANTLSQLLNNNMVAGITFIVLSIALFVIPIIIIIIISKNNKN